MSEEQINVQEIIGIHADIIRDFGGAPGIRDEATLDSSNVPGEPGVGMPYGNQPLFSTV